MRTTLAILAALVAAPAAAQTAPARTDGVAAANARVAAKIADRPIAVIGVPVEAEARYAADMAAYRGALRAHSATLVADAVFTARQERAYADAMAAWRLQVDECERGVRAACNRPTPQPADFW